MNIFQIILIEPLTNGLILFYNLLGQNLGIAIIVFSLALRVLLMPLTRPYMESMKKMKEYAPAINKLKEKHKGDKKKQMAAQADFYKEKGINPGAGCLPYLLQIVILIALFNVFTTVLSSNGEMTGKLNNLLYEPLKLAEDAVINTKFLYFDITKPDTYIIPGLPFPIPGLLVVLAAIVQFLSAKISMPFVEDAKKAAAGTKAPEDDMTAAMQSSMIYTFPLVTLVAGMRFASGLALYWLVFSLFQLIIQFRSTGLGGLTPWVRKLKLVKST